MSWPELACCAFCPGVNAPKDTSGRSEVSLHISEGCVSSHIQKCDEGDEEVTDSSFGNCKHSVQTES